MLAFQARLEEKFAAQGTIPVDEVEKEAYIAGAYLARITLEALQELFDSARNTMAWLGMCARVVALQGEPMSWVTPLGLPVTQPYRIGGILSVKTVLQTVKVVHQSDDLNVHVQRQKSAFPPNFVHSLDSTHMLLTAIRMQKLNLSFTSVHDSYWTHPCSVGAMNSELRGAFVDLYSMPILEDLLMSLRIRFPKAHFPEIPARGNLRLEDVRCSTYFFN